MRESDWALLLAWNLDPEVTYFSEGADVGSYALDEVKRIYTTVSQTATCFIMEHAGEPIGECWLQEENLPRVLEKYPALDCRRIDLTIGRKRLWNRGLGTEAIATLTRWGFDCEGADRIYGHVLGHNSHSRHAFERIGYLLEETVPSTESARYDCEWDLVFRREDWLTNPRLP